MHWSVSAHTMGDVGADELRKASHCAGAEPEQQLAPSPCQTVLAADSAIADAMRAKPELSRCVEGQGEQAGV